MKAEELAHFEDGKLFLTYGEERRELGEVKDTEEQAIAYFKEKFDSFQSKVNEMLVNLAEDSNKGSYLGKIDSFMALCGTLKALGDFGPVLTSLLHAKSEIEEVVKANRVKNTAVKTEFLARVNKVIEAEDWLAGVEEIKEVRQAWIKTGKAEKEAALTTEFDEAVTAFYVEHKRLLSLKTELQSLRVEELERIITALRGYDASKGWDVYNELRDQWKKVEHVPAVIYKPLFDVYKDLCSKVDLGIKAVRKRESKPKATSGKDPKAELLKEILKLKADYAKDLRAKLSDIQERWKKLPRQQSDFKYLGAFRDASDFLYENLRLEGQCDKRNLEGDDRKKEKQRLLKRGLKMDKEELSRLEDSPFAAVGGGKNAFTKRLNEIESRMKVKEEILKSL
jgi:hypothetical protein